MVNIKHMTTSLLSLSLEEAKQHLRVDEDYDEDDVLIESYIKAAQSLAEEHIGYNVLETGIDLTQPNFDPIVFYSKNDVVNIKTVIYQTEEDGAFESLSDENYKIKKSVVSNCFDIAFSGGLPENVFNVTVRLIVGGLVEDQPEIFKQAVRLQLSEFYDKRENTAEVNSRAFHALLRPLKRW